MTSGNYAVFFPSDIPHFILYDAVTGKWSLSSEVPALGWEASFVTANDQIYIAGWEGVWRVQF